MNEPTADQCTFLEERASAGLLQVLPLSSASINNKNLLSGKVAGGNIMLNKHSRYLAS